MPSLTPSPSPFGRGELCGNLICWTFAVCICRLGSQLIVAAWQPPTFQAAIEG
ncbi:hypothetical protein CYA_2772 [Synechococcus sp. JA-3-3Ab]|nr:hypothetical protein CYA_2772 [Synechococcus sp. JA-3-3Ab]